ncbi:MAG: transglycosylase SLT domain-containing protein [Pyrinomonadaceae bacterium]
MKFKRFSPIKTFSISGFAGLILLSAFALSCSAQPTMTDEQALASLRDMTKSGTMPSESFVQNIENRFAGRKTGALARLLRARIKIENGDPKGAASLLSSDLFEKQTALGDYALWLKGKAEKAAGENVSAQKSFNEVVSKYPNSLRVREARLLLAESLFESGAFDGVLSALDPLVRANDGDALYLASKAYGAKGDLIKQTEFLRRAYFYAPLSDGGKSAEQDLITAAQDLEPKSAEEILARAQRFYQTGNYRDASEAFEKYAGMGTSADNEVNFKRVRSFSKIGQMQGAMFVFEKLPASAKERPQAYYELISGYARGNDWASVQLHVGKMRLEFPGSEWTPRTMVAVGEIASSKKRMTDASYYFRSTIASYPDAIENTKAQFDLAWTQHELKNYPESAKMLTEHLARYVDKDTSFRGQAGYWAARDSEKAGLIDEACALYDATIYRYGANWYGYLALQKVGALRLDGKCQTTKTFPVDSFVPKAVENLKVVTVAPETAGQKELKRAEKSEELSTIGLFDWAIAELVEAKKTANESPSVNLSLARYYRLQGDNVRAFLALKESYPDYSQMFPEEMTREEWDIFYPLINWNDIKFWSDRRALDPYTVAGLIRQETIFNPKAKSGANAYGLMQLLIPTARTMARKYGAAETNITGTSLFNPQLNIELGTAYMREQLTKYGRIEYMSVAYNAGPGRVVSWKQSLPSEMDEFVEEIPFNETKGYVKGVIRNSAQYRRLYDETGKFKSNVGSKPVRAIVEKLPKEKLTAALPEVKVRKGAQSE